MYDDNMKIVRRGFQKAGANATDIVAIKRMMNEGATPLEVSQKLLIKQAVIDSFFNESSSQADHGEGVNMANAGDDASEGKRGVALAPKTFKEVLSGKRR